MKILKAERGSRLLYIGVGRFTQRIYELPDMKVRISGFCAMRAASLDDRARCLEIDLELKTSQTGRPGNRICQVVASQNFVSEDVVAYCDTALITK